MMSLVCSSTLITNNCNHIKHLTLIVLLILASYIGHFLLFPQLHAIACSHFQQTSLAKPVPSNAKSEKGSGQMRI